MLSTSLNISEFCKIVKDRSYQEIIELANEEATAVERLCIKSQHEADHAKIVRYAGYLKDFILYMRHGVRTRATRDLNFAPFKKIRLDH